MKYIAILIILTGCATRQKPLCRHIVLSQYAAFKDAGYETEIWHMENDNPALSGGFKYHAAVRIKVDGQWQWVEQPALTFTTTKQQPTGTTLREKMDPRTLIEWAEKETGK